MLTNEERRLSGVACGKIRGHFMRIRMKRIAINGNVTVSRFTVDIKFKRNTTITNITMTTTITNITMNDINF